MIKREKKLIKFRSVTSTADRAERE